MCVRVCACDPSISNEEITALRLTTFYFVLKSGFFNYGPVFLPYHLVIMLSSSSGLYASRSTAHM